MWQLVTFLCFCQSSIVMTGGLSFAISSASSLLCVNGPKVAPSLLATMYENPHGSCFSVFIVKLRLLFCSQLLIFPSFHLLVVVSRRHLVFYHTFGISALVGLFSNPLHSGLCLLRRLLVVYSHANSVRKNVCFHCVCFDHMKGLWVFLHTVMHIVVLLRCHEVNSWNAASFFTDPVNDYSLLLLSKQINSYIPVLSFKFINLWNRCWEINACKVQSIFCWVARWSYRFSTSRGRKKNSSKCPPQTLVISVLCVKYRFLVFHLLGQGHIASTMQWAILCHAENFIYHATRSSLRPGFYLAFLFINKLIEQII